MISKNDIAGIVLAGGLSRRMGGREKSLIDLGGKPMIAHVLNRLSPQTGIEAINANGDPARFDGLGHNVIADTIEGNAGPLAGILAGLRWATEHNKNWIASVAADTPFLPDNLVMQLSAKAAENKIILATSNDRLHPVVGLWPVSLADDLEHHLTHNENRKVMAFVERHPLARVQFPDITMGENHIDPFFNVNTPEDLEKAEIILKAQQ